LSADFADYTDFGAKIKGEGFKMRRLGKMGKIETCENGRKLLKNGVKPLKTFKN